MQPMAAQELVAMERLPRTAALAPAAIQVVLPDWLPLQPDEVLTAFDRMAAAAEGVPLVLYQPPHRSVAEAAVPELFPVLDSLP